VAARKPSADEVLGLIADRAEQLRRAGVTRVAVEGFSFELAPLEPEPVVPPKAEPEVHYTSALDDPSTYANGRVPGFERPGKEAD
jgi:hypothetical protein